MLNQIIAALIAVALVLVYVSPMLIKMKEPALAIVILIGVVTMLFDLWHSLRKPDD